MEENTKETTKKVGGLASLVLPHVACLSLGACEGSMNSIGLEFDIPFRYLWASNVAGTGIGNALLNEDKYDGGLKKIIKGAVTGTIAAPLEYAVGYGLGYCGQWIANKVF